jgi:hypothetical protein
MEHLRFLERSVITLRRSIAHVIRLSGHDAPQLASERMDAARPRTPVAARINGLSR